MVLWEHLLSLKINQSDFNSEFSISPVIKKITNLYENALFDLLDNDANIKNNRQTNSREFWNNQSGNVNRCSAKGAILNSIVIIRKFISKEMC